MASKKETPVIGTKDYVVFAVKGERDAVKAKQSTNDERADAARMVYRGFAAWAGTDKSADADTGMALYYTSEDMPKGDTYNSRKREWNNIIEAARADMEKTLAIWPERAEKTRSITKKMFLEGCTMVHKEPALSSAKILERLRAKKAPSNAGDLLAEIFGEKGIMLDLFTRFPHEYGKFQEQLNAARATWANGRAAGEYLTTDEMVKRASADIVPLVVPKAA